MSNKILYMQMIWEEVQCLGFVFVGFVKVICLDEEVCWFEVWLNKGMYGEMGYLENYFEKWVDFWKFVLGVKMVVMFMYNYYIDCCFMDLDVLKILKYVYGKDYYFVFKYKFKDLMKYIYVEIGEVNGWVFVDFVFVLECDWVKCVGIGWLGKNILLIYFKVGFYFFLAELIIDLDLVYDYFIKDYCGICICCIDVCFIDVISFGGYVVDGSKCIFYFIIELKGVILEVYCGYFENWMFGCDICQDVCFWN